MKILKNKFAKIILTMLGVISITIISSCNNDDEAPATPVQLPTNSNFIRCKIDDVAYEATGTQITTLSDASAFNFRSDAATGIGMHFSLMGAPTVSTYSLNGSNCTSSTLAFKK